ncbi:MAG: response regulator [Bacteroidota bacterium]
MKTILVIDDDNLVLRNVKDVLVATGFNVITATDGKSGLKIALEAKPDLIVCDLMMPELNGFELIKSLRGSINTISIPIIIVSTIENKKQMQESINIGADDFLSKPFSPEALWIKIDNLLKKTKDVKYISENSIKQLTLNLASSLPHELRTPLNGIIGSADYLVKFGNTLSQNELNEFHKVLYQAANRLNELIIRYLLFVDTEIILADVDKLVTARNAIAFLPKNRIENLIHDFINTKGKNHIISYNFENSNIKIYEEHLNFIIKELLENAVKFSNEQTHISISGLVVGNEYVLECSDNGRGLSNSEIKQLSTMKQFKREFYEQQGLGLGLAIIQRLVKIYEGTFNIESELNKYTKITIKLKCIN